MCSSPGCLATTSGSGDLLHICVDSADTLIRGDCALLRHVPRSVGGEENRIPMRIAKPWRAQDRHLGLDIGLNRSSSRCVKSIGREPSGRSGSCRGDRLRAQKFADFSDNTRRLPSPKNSSVYEREDEVYCAGTPRRQQLYGSAL